MKFTHVLLSLVFPALALADGPAIVTALNNINSAAQALGDAVREQSVLSLLPISIDSLKLLDVTKQGTKTADQSAPLSVDETVTLLAPVTTLSQTVNQTITSLIDAKSRFQDLLVVDPIIYQTLLAQKDASTDFSNAVVAKVPTALQPFSETLTQPIIDSINQGIAAYAS